MLSIRQDPKVPIAWHIGNAIPSVEGRRVVFEADGAELDMILAAMRTSSPGSPVAPPSTTQDGFKFNLAPPPAPVPLKSSARVRFVGALAIHPPDGINNRCVMYATDDAGAVWARVMQVDNEWGPWSIDRDPPTR